MRAWCILALFIAVPAFAQPAVNQGPGIEPQATPPVGAYQSLIVSQAPEVYWPLSDPPGAYRVLDLVRGIWTYPVWDAQLSLGAPGIPGDPGSTAWSYNAPDDGTPPRYFQIGQHKRTNIVNSPMSIAVWFRASVATELVNMDIVNKVAAYGPGNWDSPWAGGGYGMGTSYWTGTQYAALCNGGVYDCDVVQGTHYVTPFVWHHLAFTFDGTTLRLYFDGMLDGEAVAVRPHMPAGNNGPLRIGATTVHEFWCEQDPHNAYCGFGGFHGSMQHLGLWRRALTPAEITAQYALGSGAVTAVDPQAGDPPKPNGAVRLADVRGSYMFDLSGRRVRVEHPGIYFVSRRTILVTR